MLQSIQNFASQKKEQKNRTQFAPCIIVDLLEHDGSSGLEHRQHHPCRTAATLSTYHSTAAPMGGAREHGLPQRGWSTGGTPVGGAGLRGGG